MRRGDRAGVADLLVKARQESAAGAVGTTSSTRSLRVRSNRSISSTRQDSQRSFDALPRDSTADPIPAPRVADPGPNRPAGRRGSRREIRVALGDGKARPPPHGKHAGSARRLLSQFGDGGGSAAAAAQGSSSRTGLSIGLELPPSPTPKLLGPKRPSDRNMEGPAASSECRHCGANITVEPHRSSHLLNGCPNLARLDKGKNAGQDAVTLSLPDPKRNERPRLPQLENEDKTSNKQGKRRRGRRSSRRRGSRRRSRSSHAPVPEERELRMHEETRSVGAVVSGHDLKALLAESIAATDGRDRHRPGGPNTPPETEKEVRLGRFVTSV